MPEKKKTNENYKRQRRRLGKRHSTSENEHGSKSASRQRMKVTSPTTKSAATVVLQRQNHAKPLPSLSNKSERTKKSRKIVVRTLPGVYGIYSYRTKLVEAPRDPSPRRLRLRLHTDSNLLPFQDVILVNHASGDDTSVGDVSDTSSSMWLPLGPITPAAGPTTALEPKRYYPKSAGCLHSNTHEGQLLVAGDCALRCRETTLGVDRGDLTGDERSHFANKGPLVGEEALLVPLCRAPPPHYTRASSWKLTARSDDNFGQPGSRRTRKKALPPNSPPNHARGSSPCTTASSPVHAFLHTIAAVNVDINPKTHPNVSNDETRAGSALAVKKSDNDLAEFVKRYSEITNESKARIKHARGLTNVGAGSFEYDDIANGSAAALKHTTLTPIDNEVSFAPRRSKGISNLCYKLDQETSVNHNPVLSKTATSEKLEPTDNSNTNDTKLLSTNVVSHSKLKRPVIQKDAFGCIDSKMLSNLFRGALHGNETGFQECYGEIGGRQAFSTDKDVITWDCRRLFGEVQSDLNKNVAAVHNIDTHVMPSDYNTVFDAGGLSKFCIYSVLGSPNRRPTSFREVGHLAESIKSHPREKIRCLDLRTSLSETRKRRHSRDMVSRPNLHDPLLRVPKEKSHFVAGSMATAMDMPTPIRIEGNTCSCQKMPETVLESMEHPKNSTLPGDMRESVGMTGNELTIPSGITCRQTSASNLHRTHISATDCVRSSQLPNKLFPTPKFTDCNLLARIPCESKRHSDMVQSEIQSTNLYICTSPAAQRETIYPVKNSEDTLTSTKDKRTKATHCCSKVQDLDFDTDSLLYDGLPGTEDANDNVELSSELELQLWKENVLAATSYWKKTTRDQRRCRHPHQITSRVKVSGLENVRSIKDVMREIAYSFWRTCMCQQDTSTE